MQSGGKPPLKRQVSEPGWVNETTPLVVISFMCHGLYLERIRLKDSIAKYGRWCMVRKCCKIVTTLNTDDSYDGDFEVHPKERLFLYRLPFGRITLEGNVFG